MTISASIGKHLAFAPVAFAVTEGREHALVYANAAFRNLQAAGEIRLGALGVPMSTSADLTPLLDVAFTTATTLRDAALSADGSNSPQWSCTVWPVTDAGPGQPRLVIEVRDARLLNGARERQRAIAERLVLSALREQDLARTAAEASDRANFLARASRDLSMSLDEATTRDTIRRLTLPRPGTWCIVDVIESNGAVVRLGVEHPDESKRALARQLEEQWPAKKTDTMTTASVVTAPRPVIVSHESGAALMLAAHGEENLRILREIGFGYLLVVPLVVRARVQGAITFISSPGDPPFTPDETALAVDVASRCALALDNARLYREADALRLAAEMANQSKSQFLGAMSHELRTPLNAIGGFTELIDMGIRGPVTEEQHVALARIKANQEHLLMLITEILNFVRIESGRMEYKNAEVGLCDALGDVASMLESVAAERGLKIEVPPSAPDAVAWADPDRVRQVLVNLVMNAVKYTRGTSGGTITLWCEKRGDTAVATVTDTGAGIPPERLESIFEPFVQLTSGLADRRGGVGLGLAISRDLSRAMNGELTVESTVGVGSTFTLTLPLAPSGDDSSNP